MVINQMLVYVPAALVGMIRDLSAIVWSTAMLMMQLVRIQNDEKHRQYYSSKIIDQILELIRFR